MQKVMLVRPKTSAIVASGETGTISFVSYDLFELEILQKVVSDSTHYELVIYYNLARSLSKYCNTYK
jgi:hypothetical protein